MFGWLKGKDKKDKNKDKEEKDENNDNNNNDEEVKEDYDPENDNSVKEYKEECLTDFSKDYPGYLTLTREEILELAKDYEPYEPNGDLRHEEGYKKGGRFCADNEVVTKIRSIGKYMLKQVGKKILTGQLNLTKISFPISAMIPKSTLETSVHYTCLFPLYLNKAAQTTDPLERLKLVTVSCLSSFFYTNTFLKPLNPILGETLHGTFPDGTNVYCEQISHHPPVTYIYTVGPNSDYKYYGYYDYDAGAGLNSLYITNKGKRYFEFKDGQKIEFNFPNEQYSGSFMGTLRQESLGKMFFRDEKNNLEIIVELGKVKKKPTDYLSGKIMKDGQQIGTLEGTYLGFLDIDGKRYWDYTKITPHRPSFESDNLGSDHRVRCDLTTLLSGDVKLAQKEKEKLEVIQRSDRKLREEHAKVQKKEQKQAEKDAKKNKKNEKNEE